MTSSSINDPATRYARGVVAGSIVAGPYVRGACRRHLEDLECGSQRGLSWDVAAVERVLEYFRVILTVEIELQDEFGETVSEAVPFVPHESQEFILGSLFGWRNAAGHRRFRRAYIEIGKGNGKSPLAAGIGHYMLTATRKLRAEVYSAATDRDQAAILFRDAVEMWKRSPELYNRLVPSGQNPVWQLTMISSASFFKPISSEKKGKSGIRPYCALIDEVHEHPDNSVIEMLRAGTKGNQQALILEITNSGFDRNSVCWKEHEYAVKVALGEVQNDSWFSYVCALDGERKEVIDGVQVVIPADEPFEDEACWLKVNPLLGVSIQPEYVREQVREAKGIPSKESLVRRLHFCQWTDSEVGWVSKELWESCEAELDIDDYAGRECYGGLDLSYTQDLTAFALVFPIDVDQFDVFCWFWKPQDGLKIAIKSDGLPYDEFVKRGDLFLTPGKVIKLGPVGLWMAACADKHDLQCIAYDKYRHRELADDLADLGISELPMAEHPQGFRRAKVEVDGKLEESPLWMPSSFQAFENALIEQRIRINVNHLLRSNVAAAVVRQDPAGTDNRILDKRKSRGRIDGLYAVAMGVGAAQARPVKKPEPQYQVMFLGR